MTYQMANKKLEKRFLHRKVFNKKMKVKMKIILMKIMFTTNPQKVSQTLTKLLNSITKKYNKLIKRDN